MLCHVLWSQVEYKVVCFIYDFVMFVESMLSVLVRNDVQIPQNLLKFDRKPTYTCSFN